METMVVVDSISGLRLDGIATDAVYVTLESISDATGCITPGSNSWVEV